MDRRVEIHRGVMRALRAIGCATTVLAAATNAPAAIMNWNATNGSFDDPARWSPTVVPGPADTARIANGGVCTVGFIAPDLTVKAVEIGGFGSELLVPGFLNCEDLSITSNGIARLSGMWQVSDEVVLGSTNGTFGELQIDDGFMTSRVGTLGPAAGSNGEVLVTARGFWQIAESLTVGRSGIGTLILQNDGYVSVGANGDGIIKLAELAGSTGTLLYGNGIVATPPYLTAGSIHGGAGNATIVVAHSDDFEVFPTRITGSTKLEIRMGTTLMPNAYANTYTGGTRVTGGTLMIEEGTVLGAAGGPVRLEGGVLEVSGGSVTLQNPLQLIMLPLIDIPQNSTLTLTGAVSGAASELNYSRPGRLVFSGAAAHALNRLVADNGVIEVRGQTGPVTVTASNGIRVATPNHTSAIEVRGTAASPATLIANSFMTVGDYIGLAGQPGGIGTLTIGDHGTVRMGNAAKIAFGWVDASGTLNLQPGGTLEVGGADGIFSHATGTHAINWAGGTIKVINANLTSGIDMVLTGGNPILDTNGMSATLSGPLSGTALLDKNGVGTLTLSGANSFSGIIVNDGTVTRTVAGAFPDGRQYGVNGGTLNLGSFPLTVATLNGGGGVVQLNGQDLTIDGSTNCSFFGNINGAAGAELRKQGTSTFTLHGGGNFPGGTTVSGGALVVTGTLPGNANVATGATLGGSGVIGAAVQIANGGKLSPGASVGVLTANSSVTLNGELKIDLAGALPGEYDQLRVTSGNVTLGAAATLAFGQLDGEFAEADTLFIVNKTNVGAITGRFAGLPDGGAAGTPVQALAGVGGADEWRIYYAANAATGALTGGNDIALVVGAIDEPALLGDMNCDGTISVGDIGGFVLALTDAAGYAAQYPTCDIALADMNADGSVTVGDIGAFVSLLTGI